MWPLMSRTMNSNGKRCHEHIEPKVVMKKRIESLVGWLMKNLMGWSRLTTEKVAHWVGDIVEIAGVNGRERFGATPQALIRNILVTEKDQSV